MAVKESKRTSWENFGNEIENNFMEHRKKFCNVVKGLKGTHGKPAANLRNKENELIIGKKNILENGGNTMGRSLET